MTKQLSSTRPVVRRRPGHFTGFWFLVLLLALAGMIVAACSREPTIWMLRWPAPLVVIFTVANFIRQGFHRRDGLLVLGQAARPVSDHQANSEALVTAGNDLEVPVTNGSPTEQQSGTARKPEARGKPTLDAAIGRYRVFPRVSSRRSRELHVPRSLAWSSSPSH